MSEPIAAEEPGEQLPSSPTRYTFKFIELASVSVARMLRDGDFISDDALVETLAETCPSLILPTEVREAMEVCHRVPGAVGRPTKGRLTTARLIKRLTDFRCDDPERTLVNELVRRLRAPASEVGKRQLRALTHIPEHGPKRNAWIWWTHRRILEALTSGDGTLSGFNLADHTPSKKLPPKRLALVVTRNFMRDRLRLKPPTLGTLRNIISQYSRAFVQQKDLDQG